MDFSWDPKKARSNLRKHGVSFADAMTAFEDPYAVRVADEGRPERFVLTGFSADECLPVVVHVEYVDDDWVRIISARKATRAERRRHAEAEGG